jgi:hypothetical protein
LAISFNTFFPDDFIDSHPGIIQALIKIGPVAGKFIALVTEINPHLLVARPYSAVFKKFALFVSTTTAVLTRKIIEHRLEVTIFFKNWIPQQGFEPLGIDVEVTQFFLELDAEFSDIAVYVGETGFTAQAAWGNGFFDRVVRHDVPP